MKVLMPVVFILLFALAVFSQTEAEVIVPSTFLRKSPNPTAEKLQSVSRGEKLTLEKTQDTGGWYYVSILNGKVKGWVNGNAIRIAAADSPKTDQTGAAATVQTRQDSALPNIQTSSAATNPAAASGQTETPKEEDEVLRVETEEVSLNVRVVDADNRPVQNLKQAHFEVYENEVRQEITSLTTSEVPINYALLVDNSRSLRSQLEKIAEAGKIIVGTNRPADESTIVRFVSRDKIEVMQNFTTDRRRLDEALDSLFTEGGQTAIIDAVYETAKRVDEYEKSRSKDDRKRRALILVSDGEDRGSERGEQQLFELLRASDVQIYAIGFTNALNDQAAAAGESPSRREKARAFLTRLAAETGGKVYFPNSVDELSQIASDISADLRTQYLITYAPSGERQDKNFRNIKVVVAEGANKEKRTAITRTGRTSGRLPR